jgi:hypothetical protein
MQDMMLLLRHTDVNKQLDRIIFIKPLAPRHYSAWHCW